MSEKMPVSAEQARQNIENMPSPEHSKIEHHAEKHGEHSSESNNEKSLSEIRQNIAEKAAPTAETIKHASGSEKTKAPQTTIDNELKDMMFTRTLNRVQRQLSPGQRVFSKTIHSNVVEKASNIGEKTIARPIGIIFGGIFALLGSVFSAYLAKQFGMKYNPIVFCILFVGGYLIGSILELLYKLIRRPS